MISKIIKACAVVAKMITTHPFNEEPQRVVYKLHSRTQGQCVLALRFCSPDSPNYPPTPPPSSLYVTPPSTLVSNLQSSRAPWLYGLLMGFILPGTPFPHLVPSSPTCLAGSHSFKAQVQAPLGSCSCHPISNTSLLVFALFRQFLLNSPNS